MAAKIVVIGIDGAPWEYINPLLSAGRLPNLARLMEQGSFGVLRSTVPPLSPVAWSSFLTGRRPERHGIFDFWHPEAGGSFRPALSTDRQGSPFWRPLNRAGIGCAVVNIPLTHPPEPLKGFLIAGFDAPATPRQKVYPEGLHAALRRRYGPRVFETPPPETARSDPERFFAGYAEHDRLQTAATIELANRHGLGVVAINLMFNDHLSHLMADFSYVERGLEVSDENIGRLRQAFPEASLIVMSDHGSGRTRATFLIFDWLLREGLIRLDARRAAVRRLNSALGCAFRKRLGICGLPEKLLRRSLLPLASCLPRAAQEALIRRLARQNDFYWPWELLDPATSPVTMCSPATGGFYLNGEPGLREELARRLAGLADDEGRPIFSRIARREETYAANGLTERAPQLLASSDLNIYTNARLRPEGPLTIANEAVAYYGNHTPEGIYVLAGGGFAGGFREPLHIWDVPAMILALAGLAVPADYETTLPEGVLRRPLVRETAAAPAESAAPEAPLSPEDLAAVQERLKGLGYM